MRLYVTLFLLFLHETILGSNSIGCLCLCDQQQVKDILSCSHRATNYISPRSNICIHAHHLPCSHVESYILYKSASAHLSVPRRQKC